ncbi:hypothetical protein ACFP1Z_28485 [Streptomyces gamaensis]|uniref:DNA-binding protein n=1 Tax=Streptomyces gamaensis TaxID=1763542 RepID=A0ABW0Z7K3_9ACTN
MSKRKNEPQRCKRCREERVMQCSHCGRAAQVFCPECDDLPAELKLAEQRKEEQRKKRREMRKKIDPTAVDEVLAAPDGQPWFTTEQVAAQLRIKPNSVSTVKDFPQPDRWRGRNYWTQEALDQWWKENRTVEIIPLDRQEDAEVKPADGVPPRGPDGRFLPRSGQPQEGTA